MAGIHCPTDDFLRGLRKAATETGTQLILDEIQSGYGRTGHFFAHQAAGIRPDLITTAKGMGNGFHFEARPGLLGTTFGGNHLACAAAIAVLDVMERDGLVENAATVGEYLLGELHKTGGLKEVRGRGLMIGIEIDGSGAEFRRRLDRAAAAGTVPHARTCRPVPRRIRCDAPREMSNPAPHRGKTP